LIELKNINLSLGTKQLFNDLNWKIKSGKKIGLFGPNGTGKTTLLNLLTGTVDTDSGDLVIPTKSVIGYLPQEVELNYCGTTLLEEALTVFNNLYKLEKELYILTHALSETEDVNSPDYLTLINKLNIIEAELKASEFEQLQSRTEKMLMGLGFNTEDFDRQLSNFSGGWRMRIELAKLLLINPDLLLLDEPTNHLDIESIEWLECYLNTFEGTVVVVSHDKYFLDRMVDTVAELLNGKITEFSGNYTSYLEQKKTRLANQASAYENQQRVIKQYERFIERFRYKNTKARQVQSRIKMLEKMDKIDQVESDRVVKFKFPETTRSGKTVMRLSQFSKSYEQSSKIFENSEPLIIERGDKIALIGKNGIGKSTLIRIIYGSEDFEGVRNFGHSVEVAYFAQNQTEYLIGENDIITELINSTDTAIYNETTIRTILGAFLFSGDDVYKKIKVLSGGEKSRVALAKCLLSPKNFLILDEPTNHLDIQSRSVLIEALNQYSGTYIVVSHDRYFLDQVCNKVWYINNKKVHSYPGNYSDYLYHRDKSSEFESSEDTDATTMDKAVENDPDTKSKKRADAERRNRYFNILKVKGIENFTDWDYLSKNQLSNVLEEIETLIETREAEKIKIEELLIQNETHKDINKSNKLSIELHNINTQLNNFYEKWDKVSNLLEN